jgi:hypothetical protein
VARRIALRTILLGGQHGALTPADRIAQDAGTRRSGYGVEVRVSSARREPWPYREVGSRPPVCVGRNYQVTVSKFCPELFPTGPNQIQERERKTRLPLVRSAEELPLYEFDFNLTQKEGLTFVGDPDYVGPRDSRPHAGVGAGVFMGLFQFGSLPLATKNIELFAKTVLPALRRE